MAGWTDAHATEHTDNVDAMQRRLDVEWRALAFDLAMRLREAEFLACANGWDSGWAQGKRIKTKDLRVRLLRAMALLTPCVACTVYRGASFGCFFDGQAQANRPLSVPIDLLIYDEAGQILPDHGLPLLGLARRAVAVGDIHQLEPIPSFSDIADEALMRAVGADREDAINCRKWDWLTPVAP